MIIFEIIGIFFLVSLVFAFTVGAVFWWRINHQLKKIWIRKPEQPSAPMQKGDVIEGEYQVVKPESDRLRDL